MVGGVLCRLAAIRWDVFGVYYRRRPRFGGAHLFQMDLTRRDQVVQWLKQVRPQAVIHTAAVADVGYCQQHEQLTAGINAQVPVWLAEWCAGAKSFYGFTSTDLVFDGGHAPYNESCPVSPLSVYAHQKVQAERGVAECYPQAAVFRLPLLIGLPPEAPHGRLNFCHQMLASIQSGNRLVLFADEYRTPVDVISAAEGILALLTRHQGFLHLGGPRRISRYRLGLMMAAAMNRSPGMIKGNTIAGSQTVPRAPDVSLDSRRAFELGYQPAPLETAVQRVSDQFSIISKS